MAEERTCGGCTACCKTHKIPEIFKPARTWCVECQIGKGCAIYEARPDPCRTFRCQWLLGGGTDADRPDRSKLVVDYKENLDIVDKLVIIHEVSHGGFRRVTPLIENSLRKGMSVLLIPHVGASRLIPARTLTAAERRRLSVEQDGEDVNLVVKGENEP